MRWWLPVAAICIMLVVAGGKTMLNVQSERVHAPAPRRGPDLAALATLPTTRPAFHVRTPKPLSAGKHVAVWAALNHAAVARRAPAPDADPIVRLATKTPEGTTNLVVVLRQHLAVDGSIWDLVRLPILPNGSTGWLPRSALNGYNFVSTHLYVELRPHRLALMRRGRVVFTAPIGIGRPGTPTPTGRFYIRDRLTRYASPFYGPVAFGTSARSPILTDWPAGGYIGIHGTDRPGRLPGAVSHGCIRLRNSDIRRLAALMPVGTPVTIVQQKGQT
jgi:hypothetical protein